MIMDSTLENDSNPDDDDDDDDDDDEWVSGIITPINFCCHIKVADKLLPVMIP